MHEWTNLDKLVKADATSCELSKSRTLSLESNPINEEMNPYTIWEDFMALINEYNKIEVSLGENSAASFNCIAENTSSKIDKPASLDLEHAHTPRHNWRGVHSDKQVENLWTRNVWGS